MAFAENGDAVFWREQMAWYEGSGPIAIQAVQCHILAGRDTQVSSHVLTNKAVQVTAVGKRAR